MSGRVRTCVVTILACAGFILVVGCGKKKQEGAQNQIDTTAGLAEEDTATFNDTVSSGKTLEDVEQYMANKPKGNAMPAAPGEFVENGRYAIQISSSRFERSSQKLVDKLKEQNIPAYISEVENPTSDLLGTYYRVRVGYFGGVSSARSYGPTLAGMGYEWWVDNRSNDNAGLSGEAIEAAPTPASTPSGSVQDLGFGGSSPYGSTSGSESGGSPMPSSTMPSSSTPSSMPSTGTSSAPVDFGTSSSTSASDWGSSTDTAGTGWQ